MKPGPATEAWGSAKEGRYPAKERRGSAKETPGSALEQVDQDLGAPLGAELVPLPFQAGAQLLVVVDLAVEGDDDRAVFVGGIGWWPPRTSMMLRRRTPNATPAAS